MFLLISKYVKNLEMVDADLNAHRLFLKKYYDLGKFICSGRKEPRDGGVILCRAEHRQELLDILKEDPFFSKEISEYEIIEFIPTMYANGFEKYI